MRKAVLPVVLATLVAGRADATKEVWDMSLEELLDTPVESATRSEVSILDTPQAVTVLLRSDLEQIPALNLAEILRAAVGVNVVRVQSSQNVVGLRGGNAFAPAKVLILIDGQPIDPTLFSTTWWDLLPIELQDIERIEVIRSPGTIYGANAQNGVVNIVTRKVGLDEPDRHVGLASGGYGQQDMVNGYAGYAGKAAGVAYRLSVGLRNLDAYETGETIEIIPGRPSKPGEQTFDDSKTQLRALTVSAGAQARIAGTTFGGAAGVKLLDQVQGRVPDRLCFVGMDGLLGYANLTDSFEGAGARHSLRLGMDLARYRFVRNSDSMDPQLTPAGITAVGLSSGYELQRTVAGSHELLLGAGVSLQSAYSTSTVPMFADNKVRWEPSLSAPLQYHWRMREHSHLYAGGLASYHHVSGPTFAPMLAVVHGLNATNKLRLAAYTSYRNPSIFEHSIDYDQTTGAAGKRTQMVSNRGLDAERTISLELGYRGEPAAGLLVGADTYLAFVRDGIEWTQDGVNDTDGARPIYRSENTLRQRIAGGELMARYYLNRHVQIEGNGAATFLDNQSSVPAYAADVNGLGEGRYGDSYVPPVILNAIVHLSWRWVRSRLAYRYTAAHDWQWPRWDSMTGVDAFDAKPVPGHQVVDVNFRFDIVRHLDLTLSGTNVLDARHTEWRGDESYFGRQVWVNLAARN